VAAEEEFLTGRRPRGDHHAVAEPRYEFRQGHTALTLQLDQELLAEIRIDDVEQASAAVTWRFCHREISFAAR
jgi:hypothetical protein